MIPSIPKMSLLSADGGIWPSLSKNKVQNRNFFTVESPLSDTPLNLK